MLPTSHRSLEDTGVSTSIHGTFYGLAAHLEESKVVLDDLIQFIFPEISLGRSIESKKQLQDRHGPGQRVGF